MLGRGFIPEISMQSFLVNKTKHALMFEKDMFLSEMVLYLGRDYDDMDSYLKGCCLLMGTIWKDQVVLSLKDDILKFYTHKEELWEKYTYID